MRAPASDGADVVEGASIGEAAAWVTFGAEVEFSAEMASDPGCPREVPHGAGDRDEQTGVAEGASPSSRRSKSSNSAETGTTRDSDDDDGVGVWGGLDLLA